MGIFSTIKEKIFGKDDAPEVETGEGAAPAVAPPQVPAQAEAPQTQPVSEVDVEERLDGMPGADELNWRTSIVDLMKLVGMDASYEEREELAEEFGLPDYDGTADDNIWLHKQLMEELAKNGGKVPASLLD